MYKLLLSWRYLRTRYLALASIISVMLGVATLIVVNSVMGGFSTKLKDRMRGLSADILIESRSIDGFYDFEGKIREVEKLVGDKVESITPVIETPAMINYNIGGYGESITSFVRLIGVDPKGRSDTGEFATHLLNPENREQVDLAFELRGKAKKEHDLYYPKIREDSSTQSVEIDFPTDGPPRPDAPDFVEEFNIPGAVVGYGIANIRNPHATVDDEVKDIPVIRPGHEIILYTTSRTTLQGHNGSRSMMKPVTQRFVVTDLFRCEMSEYDSNIIYIDINDMQRMRTMQGCATSLQIKLKDYDRDKREVVQTLANSFRGPYMVQTWEDKQVALLSAIAIERGLLNVLLFLIIAVAGFGILAIFFMIVVEKTRDIGILKALGASNKGVMGIFLSYGLGLGLVGAGLGTGLGILITVYINEIEQWLARMTGQEVFPRDVYYFDKIPTDMQTLSIVLVNLGAVFIAVSASVFPSLRAALLHPVRALRYE